MPVRQAHIDFFGYVVGESPPPVSECIGRTMVDREHYMPHGFCMAWPRENGAVTVHAYYGHFLRTYPKDILRGMKPTMDELRARGHRELWAIADENVPGSDLLVKWFKGKPTDQVVPGQGRYWTLNLDESPI